MVRLKTLLLISMMLFASLKVLADDDSMMSWDPSNVRLLTNGGHLMKDYCFSPSGKYMFSTNRDELAVWDRATLRLITYFPFAEVYGKEVYFINIAPHPFDDNLVMLELSNNPDLAILFDWKERKEVYHISTRRRPRSSFSYYKFKPLSQPDMIIYNKKDKAYETLRNNDYFVGHMYTPITIGTVRPNYNDSLLVVSGMHPLVWNMHKAKIVSMPSYTKWIVANDTTLNHESLDRYLPKPKTWDETAGHAVCNRNIFEAYITDSGTVVMGGATPHVLEWHGEEAVADRLEGIEGPVYDVKDFGDWRVVATGNGVFAGPIHGPYRLMYKEGNPEILCKNAVNLISETYNNGHFLVCLSEKAKGKKVYEGRCGDYNLSRSYDTKNWKDWGEICDIKIANDGHFALATNGYSIAELNLVDSAHISLQRIIKVPRTRSAFVESCALLPDGRYVVGLADGNVKLYDGTAWTKAPRLYASKVRSMNLSQDGAKLFSCDENDQVVIWDTKTMKPIVTLRYLYPFGVLAITPDQYYAYEHLRLPLNEVAHFSKDNRTYTFSQFDLKLNRPDIIVERLGGDAAYVSLLHKAWEKRLRRMRVKPEQLDDTYHTPDAELLNAGEIEPVTSNDSLKLVVRIKDSQQRLTRLLVWIDNVPQYGLSGKLLTSTDSVQTHTVRLKLAQGDNHVSVMAMNESGARSTPVEVFVTYYNKEKPKPILWVVSLGVSKYDDKNFSLHYASKDAKDIANLVRKSTNTFAEVKTLCLTDLEFDASAIEKAGAFLSGAGRDDAVILFFAGHGVLDANLDYYLAPHDMDFSHPASKGINVDELTHLLEYVLPLKRYVIIDACHSGGIDKEDYLADNTVSDGPGITSIQFRSVGGVQQRSNEAKMVGDLASQLFAELNSELGATVIASAAGDEVAVESDAWKNGLFTYLLKKGLGADRTKAQQGDELFLEDLVQYAAVQAAEMTQGRQHPQIKSVNNNQLKLVK